MSNIHDLKSEIADRDLKHKQSIDSIMHPSLSLLCKLGSIAVHAEEFLSDRGHHFDLSALQQLLKDAEVAAWMDGMQKGCFLPVKR